MPLIYSFVARGTTVLADYTSYSGNFSTVAIQCLEKCPTDGGSKFTYTCDKHTFNYVVSGGFSEFLFIEQSHTLSVRARLSSWFLGYLSPSSKISVDDNAIMLRDWHIK